MGSFTESKIGKLESSLNNLVLDKEQKIMEYTKCFFDTNNIGVEYYVLKKLINLDEQNIDIILYLIEITLELGDYNQAKGYISLISNIKNKQLRYLQDKIGEVNSNKKNYLSSYQKKIYITNKFNSGEYESAFFECDKYYANTKDKDFIFIKAKMLYLLNEYKEAINLFIQYISIGKKYLLETNIYLFYIFNKLDQHDIARLYSEEAYELCSSIKEIDILKFERSLLNLGKDFNNMSLLKLKKSMLFNNLKFENSKQYINKIY